MKKKGESGIALTIGSFYQINSLQSKEQCLETEGIFKGYTVIGADEGLCIEMSKKHGDLAGKIRVIPSNMIISIDIIKSKKETAHKEEGPSVYYQ